MGLGLLHFFTHFPGNLLHTAVVVREQPFNCSFLVLSMELNGSCGNQSWGLITSAPCTAYLSCGQMVFVLKKEEHFRGYGERKWHDCSLGRFF